MKISPDDRRDSNDSKNRTKDHSAPSTTAGLLDGVGKSLETTRSDIGGLLSRDTVVPSEFSRVRRNVLDAVMIYLSRPGRAHSAVDESRRIDAANISRPAHGAKLDLIETKRTEYIIIIGIHRYWFLSRRRGRRPPGVMATRRYFARPVDAYRQPVLRHIRRWRRQRGHCVRRTTRTRPEARKKKGCPF